MNWLIFITVILLSEIKQPGIYKVTLNNSVGVEQLK